tara:strand:- start:233 stop:385 length:153 start_codon:yes stop_codon:yes gene_type:complete
MFAIGAELGATIAIGTAMLLFSLQALVEVFLPAQIHPFHPFVQSIDIRLG